jgi:hypothetical protein
MKVRHVTHLKPASAATASAQSAPRTADTAAELPPVEPVMKFPDGRGRIWLLHWLPGTRDRTGQLGTFLPDTGGTGRDTTL